MYKSGRTAKKENPAGESSFQFSLSKDLWNRYFCGNDNVRASDRIVETGTAE
jgi:hypothetical protein